VTEIAEFIRPGYKLNTFICIRKDGSVVTVKADMVIGCDGAYSKVRQEMMKKTLLDYEQIFIPHGYMELSMPPAPNDKVLQQEAYIELMLTLFILS
jgi:kynurenine 3-monooxygenase